MIGTEEIVGQRRVAHQAAPAHEQRLADRHGVDPAVLALEGVVGLEPAGAVARVAVGFPLGRVERKDIALCLGDGLELGVGVPPACARIPVRFTEP